MRFMLIATLTLTAAACHSAAPDRISPYATYPDAGGGAPSTTAAGELIVYTITYPDREASRGSDQHAWRVYSGYTVYAADGTRIGYIQNHTAYPSGDEAPSTVLLAPGRYLIRTDLPQERPEIFWVTIDAAKETRVDAMNLPKSPPEEPKITP